MIDRHPVDAAPSGTLVDFAHPPVSEVALAVQFADSVATDAITIGQYWPIVREEYPDLQPQPPLAPMGENFAGAGGAPRIAFQLTEGPMPNRYWFVSSDASELIQVQPDRFAFNWRGDDLSERPYPRYPYLRGRFESHYASLVEAIEASGARAVPMWVEVTYINPIVAQDQTGKRCDLSTILRRLNPSHPPSLPSPEETNFTERYLLRRGDEPYGRFHVNAAPVLRTTDNAPTYMLTLTARGQPTTPDLDGILAFLDEGRDLIVSGFRDMTTEAMHAIWGLR